MTIRTERMPLSTIQNQMFWSCVVMIAAMIFGYIAQQIIINVTEASCTTIESLQNLDYTDANRLCFGIPFACAVATIVGIFKK